MQQISPSLYQISLGVANVFVVKDKAKGLVLIDTGYQGSMDKIFTALRKGGENPTAIKQIILTHCHPDHSGSAAALKNELGIPLLAYHLDTPLLEAGTAGMAPIYLSPGLINWVIYRLFIKNGDGAFDPVSVDIQLHDNDVLPIAGGLQVLHTPGHSAGHIALWLKQESVLIAGDLCANVAGLDYSTVYEDRTLGMSSIVKVARLPVNKAVFGHGRPINQDANKKLMAKFAPIDRAMHNK